MSQNKEVFENQSAGRLMEKNIPIVNINKTVGDAEKMLLKSKFEAVNYIYAVNNKKKLVGVVSLKELFRNPKSRKVDKVMKKKFVSVKPNADQEKVALIALEYKLKSVPVVDENNFILGVIPSHTIFNIFHSEGIEDVLHSAGIHKFKDPVRDIIHASTLTHFKKRLPWLIVGLIGGVLAALIVSSFEAILEVYVILAVFIPAVVYMADAVGNQAQTIFIRSMALDKKLNYKFYSGREFKINVLLGIFLGLIFYLIVLLGWKESFFGVILGISVFATVMISMAVSIILPIIFNKMNSDPAISTGPFATAVRDLTSLLVYFGIAQVMINIFL